MIKRVCLQDTLRICTTDMTYDLNIADLVKAIEEEGSIKDVSVITYGKADD